MTIVQFELSLCSKAFKDKSNGVQTTFYDNPLENRKKKMRSNKH